MANTLRVSTNRCPLSTGNDVAARFLLPPQNLPVHRELFHLILDEQSLHAAREIVIVEATAPVKSDDEKRLDSHLFKDQVVLNLKNFVFKNLLKSVGQKTK